MKSHSLCLSHRFYKVFYAVYLTMSLARGYNSDLGVDHWTSVKNILSGIRKCFSVMEMTKSSRFDHVMLVREVSVNGSAAFRFVCTSQISMSSCRCNYYATFGAISNNCSTWSYSKLLLHYTYPVSLLGAIRIGVKLAST